MSTATESVQILRRWTTLWVVLPAFGQITLWYSFFALRHKERHLIHFGWGFWQVSNIVLALVTACIVGLSTRFHVVWRLLVLVVWLSTTINFFAARYWEIGTTANFTHDLTPLDATYFALGTLTTAGTSPIAATSQVARAWVATQMGVDFLIIGTVIALALSDIARRQANPR